MWVKYKIQSLSEEENLDIILITYILYIIICTMYNNVCCPGKENNLADLIDKAVEENDMKLWNDIRKQIDEQRKGLEDVQRMQNEAE